MNNIRFANGKIINFKPAFQGTQADHTSYIHLDGFKI